MGQVERSRIDALMDVPDPRPVPPLTATGSFRRLWERVTTGARWKEIGHHLAAPARSPSSASSLTYGGVGRRRSRWC